MLLHTLPAKETKEAVLSHPVMSANGAGICINDLKPARKLVVYPGNEPFPLGHGVQAMPLAALCHELALKAPA